MVPARSSERSPPANGELVADAKLPRPGEGETVFCVRQFASGFSSFQRWVNRPIGAAAPAWEADDGAITGEGIA
jgi:hypothetical protein